MATARKATGKTAARKAVKKTVAKAVKKTPTRAAKKAAGKTATKTVKTTPVRKAANEAAAKKTSHKVVGKPGPVKKTATKTARKAVVKKTLEKAGKKVTKAAATPRAAEARKATPAPRKAVARKRPPEKVTPDQALANARALLEQKQEHDRQQAPWQQLDENAHGAAPGAGFVSTEAADKAVELHAAESRLKAIQGSSGTQDRRNQGKRDHRGD